MDEQRMVRDRGDFAPDPFDERTEAREKRQSRALDRIDRGWRNAGNRLDMRVVRTPPNLRVAILQPVQDAVVAIRENIYLLRVDRRQRAARAARRAQEAKGR